MPYLIGTQHQGSLIRLPSTLKSLLLNQKAWATHLKQHQQSIRPIVVESVNKVLACGTLFMGYAQFVCSNPGCSHTKKVPISCKSRFCPTCGKKATEQWIENLRAVLPDTRWQHITFTLPDVFWLLFQLNRTLLGQLSALAARAILRLSGKRGITPGLFTVLHTFGRKLNWNVHIHMSVTLGGLTEDKAAWKTIYYVKDAIMKQWRYGIITLLRKTFQAGELTLTNELKAQYPGQKGFNRLLDEQYHRPWIVHFAKATKNPKKAVNYLARYVKRPPLAMSRLKHYTGEDVRFNYLDHTTKTHKTEQCDRQDLLERLFQHIPEKGFRMVRYYGFLANRVRNTLLPTVYTLLDQPQRNALTIRFPALMKKSFGVDPLECLLCQSQMVFTGMTLHRSSRQLGALTWDLALGKKIH